MDWQTPRHGFGPVWSDFSVVWFWRIFAQEHQIDLTPNLIYFIITKLQGYLLSRRFCLLDTENFKHTITIDNLFGKSFYLGLDTANGAGKY